jgi:predicted acylesterase/phospholipase RssA
LWLPFFCVSSNLSNAETVVHRRGLVWEAIRSSVSLPGVFAPVLRGGELLVDGGVLNNLPADVIREWRGGRVVAVDVSPPADLKLDCERLPTATRMLWQRLTSRDDTTRIPTLFEILMRTTMLASTGRTNLARREADYYLRPALDRFGMLDFDALESIVDAGYRAAVPAIEAWARSAAAAGVAGGAWWTWTPRSP